MDYKLICSDIDGTLLNKERILSKKTIAVITEIRETIPVILISSRMPKAMKHLQLDLGIQNQPLIAYNGGLILIENKNQTERLLSIEIPIRLTELLLQFIEKSTIHASLYHADEWFVPEMDYWANREQNNTKVAPAVANLKEVCQHWKTENIGPHKIQCMGQEGEIQLLENWLIMCFSDELNIYRSKPTYLEIASKKISKLSALSYLLTEKTDIALAEVIAFGDNYNDLELLEGVGWGVAVANAKEAVKTVANKITLTNVEDGVALSLEEIFLNKHSLSA